MPAPINITGQRFGRLTALECVGVAPRYQRLWLCRCDCGNETVVRLGNLRSGAVQSCGCLSDWTRRGRLTHGDFGKRLYIIWSSMKQRCVNPENNRWDRYGGRGIAVCPEWQEYAPFRDWALANGYRDDLSIDRIDNDGNYEPQNCRWATAKQQANNRG